MIAYINDPNFPVANGFQFEDVSWVKLAPGGDEIYILQRGSPAVSVWDLNGNHLRDWDTQELGDPHSLTFQEFDDGSYSVWITDMAPPLTAGNVYGHCLKQFDMHGNYLGSLGACGENTQGSGLDPLQFDKVTDIAFDSHGYLWVTDGDIGGLNNRVLQIDPATQAVLQAWSAPNNQSGSGPGEFYLPHAIAVDQFERVWIADALNQRVQVIKTDGTFLQELSCFGTDGVYGICVCADLDTGIYQLLVSSSPTTAPTGGTVQIFEVLPGDLPVPDGCIAEFQWGITLPVGTSEAMLHMLDATGPGDQVFLAPLGGDLPPQKWIRVFTPD